MLVIGVRVRATRAREVPAQSPSFYRTKVSVCLCKKELFRVESLPIDDIYIVRYIYN